jgi:hypothetical protein
MHTGKLVRSRTSTGSLYILALMLKRTLRVPADMKRERELGLIQDSMELGPSGKVNIYLRNQDIPASVV